MNAPALAVVLLLSAGISTLPTHAGSHLWQVNELFSNADGTIQFVELHCPLGAANETYMNGKSVTSSANGLIYTFTTNLPPNSTSNKHLLLATQGFADLPGAPTPDHIIGVDAFSVDGDTIQFHVYAGSIMSMADGEIPTDGVHSVTRDGVTGTNTPTNFAGVSGSVVARPPGPSAVPDGSGTGTPMVVEALDASGSNLRIYWDTATCGVDGNHRLLYGQRSDLPTTPGGTLTPGGSICSIALPPPFDWNASDATDGSGLLWWLVVVEDDGVEGPWGKTGAGVERQGPGLAGSSSLCGSGSKDVTNACGSAP